MYLFHVLMACIYTYQHCSSATACCLARRMCLEHQGQSSHDHSDHGRHHSWAGNASSVGAGGGGVGGGGVGLGVLAGGGTALLSGSVLEGAVTGPAIGNTTTTGTDTCQSQRHTQDDCREPRQPQMLYICSAVSFLGGWLPYTFMGCAIPKAPGFPPIPFLTDLTPSHHAFHVQG